MDGVFRKMVVEIVIYNNVDKSGQDVLVIFLVMDKNVSIVYT